MNDLPPPLPAGAAAPRVDTEAIAAGVRRDRLRRFVHGPTARITALALGVRGFGALLAFLFNIAYPLAQPEQFTVLGHTNLFWDAFARDDSGWYFGIARYGYAYVAGGRSNLAYFPVYPLLMRYLGRLFGRGMFDYYLAGALISWTAFALALVVLYRLARLDLSRRAAERAVLYAAIFPFAFFFGKVYTESVFLLTTVTAFYAFRTRRWGLGGVSGALMTATRVNGVMALPLLAWIAWRHTAGDRRGRIAAAAALAVAAAGIGSYCAYTWWLSGSPIEWMHSIERWGYHPFAAPWTAPASLLHSLLVEPYTYLAETPMGLYDALNGGAALVVAASIPFVWRRYGAAYGLFLLANLWLPLSSGVFEGLGRYCSVMFPFFIWLAGRRSHAGRTAIPIVSASLYALCLSLFVNLHPIF
ncbi:MAG: hypothetical protein KGN76_03040 [Acidobacteriota bacterium]|nr:hypothetical protein [Acidobacteriota bacterium]